MELFCLPPFQAECVGKRVSVGLWAAREKVQFIIGRFENIVRSRYEFCWHLCGELDVASMCAYRRTERLKSMENAS